MTEQNDVTRAVSKLSGKAANYNELWKYYDGAHDLKFSSKRLREVFGGQLGDTRFVENWMGVVVDALLDKVQLTDLSVADDEGASVLLQEFFRGTELDLDADDVHRAAFVCGESFVIVWPETDADGNEVLGAYYNDPRRCHMFYDEENPKLQSMAAKWWRLPSGHWRLTLYYADHLEYFITRKVVDAVERPDPKDFIAMQEMVEGDGITTEQRWPENPYGQIPVFHFQTDRRKPKSQIKQVTPIQDAINKLFADMMVSAEFSAFKQRWFVTNADLDEIKSSPSEHMVIPANDGMGEGTQIGSFDATDLDNYLKGMGSLIDAIAAITSTPRHYFFQTSGVPSGEALRSLEAPLDGKAEKFIGLFGSTWRKLSVFAMKIMAAADLLPGDVSPVFDSPFTVQPRTTSEIREIDVRTGIPLSIALRREGWTDSEIAEVEAVGEHERTQAAERDAEMTEQAFRNAQAAQQQINEQMAQPPVDEEE